MSSSRIQKIKGARSLPGDRSSPVCASPPIELPQEELLTEKELIFTKIMQHHPDYFKKFVSDYDGLCLRADFVAMMQRVDKSHLEDVEHFAEAFMYILHDLEKRIENNDFITDEEEESAIEQVVNVGEKYEKCIMSLSLHSPNAHDNFYRAIEEKASLYTGYDENVFGCLFQRAFLILTTFYVGLVIADQSLARRCAGILDEFHCCVDKLTSLIARIEKKHEKVSKSYESNLNVPFSFFQSSRESTKVHDHLVSQRSIPRLSLPVSPIFQTKAVQPQVLLASINPPASPKV